MPATEFRVVRKNSVGANLKKMLHAIITLLLLGFFVFMTASTSGGSAVVGVVGVVGCLLVLVGIVLGWAAMWGRKAYFRATAEGFAAVEQFLGFLPWWSKTFVPWSDVLVIKAVTDLTRHMRQGGFANYEQSRTYEDKLHLVRRSKPDQVLRLDYPDTYTPPFDEFARQLRAIAPGVDVEDARLAPEQRTQPKFWGGS